MSSGKAKEEARCLERQTGANDGRYEAFEKEETKIDASIRLVRLHKMLRFIGWLHLDGGYGQVPFTRFVIYSE